MKTRSTFSPYRAYLHGKSFVLLTRPTFLFGGFLLHALGIAIAWAAGYDPDWRLAVIGQIAITTTQLVAQYANEYYDLETDRLNHDNRTWFSGGSGILPSGVMSPKVALWAAGFCAAIAFLVAISLLGSHPIVTALVLICLAGSWFYSAPPLALMGTGWGETAASLIVAVAVPLVGSFLQTDGHFLPALFITLPLALVHVAMLIVFSLPDREVDELRSKRTVAVRVGLERTAWIHQGLIATSIVCYVLLWAFAVWPLGASLAAPLVLLGQAFLVNYQVRMRFPRYRWLTIFAVAVFALIVSLALFDQIFVQPMIN